MININGETVLVSSSSLLKFLVIQLITSETSDPHVSWLISQVLVSQLARTLPNNSVVEWFRLVELFSVLSSILISVSVGLGCPAGAVPKSRVHDVSRAIIEECLSWSVQIRLVSNMLLEPNSLLLREFLGWVTIFEYGRWLDFRVDVACSESRLIGSVLRVIMWVSLRHCLSTISPRGGVECVVGGWNPLSIKSE